MLRSPANLLFFIVAPLLVFSVLASAFSSLMQSYEKKGPFQVGYMLSEESFFATGIEALKDAGKEADVIFEEYSDGDVKELMDSHDLKGFVVFKEDSYVVWSREDAKTEGQILEYVLNAYVEGVNRAKLMLMSKEAEDLELSIERPAYMPAIDSTDYYGIIEIVYFGCCALVCVAGVLGNEKKYGIGKKYRVAGLSQLQIYLGRLLPMLLCVLICECVAVLISVTLMEVHWGNLLMSGLVVIFIILAASAFELMLYEITESMVLSIICSFAVVWIAGFLGGSFETYMFSGKPQKVKMLSPLYHGNRALVELSCMGHSNYVLYSVVYLGLIFVGCSIVALLSGMIRKRG